ncbi:MAG: YihY/virulence factor BrkB family protein [Nitrospirales bacterium]
MNVEAQEKMGYSLRGLLAQTIRKWWADNALRLSAALSYYTLFSIAPVLTIAVATAGLVVNTTLVEQEMREQLAGLLGAESARAIEGMVHSAREPAAGTITTILSIVTLIVVSTGMFTELQDALNLIWRIPEAHATSVWVALKSRFLSFVLVFGSGFLLLVSLLVSAFLAGLGKYVSQILPVPGIVVKVLYVGVSFIVITILFATMFKVLPEAHVAWRDVWLGAITTASLFTIGKWAIGFYLATSPIATLYGAASSLMIILLWVYYSALIFFLGAEFTVVYAATYGSRLKRHQ